MGITDTIKDAKMAGIAPRRRAAGYTQQQLSDALGVDRVTLAQWECGLYWPSSRLLPRLAELLGCKIEELYEEERGDE